MVLNAHTEKLPIASKYSWGQLIKLSDRSSQVSIIQNIRINDINNTVDFERFLLTIIIGW